MKILCRPRVSRETKRGVPREGYPVGLGQIVGRDLARLVADKIAQLAGHLSHARGLLRRRNRRVASLGNLRRSHAVTVRGHVVTQPRGQLLVDQTRLAGLLGTRARDARQHTLERGRDLTPRIVDLPLLAREGDSALERLRAGGLVQVLLSHRYLLVPRGRRAPFALCPLDNYYYTPFFNPCNREF